MVGLVKSIVQSIHYSLTLAPGPRYLHKQINLIASVLIDCVPSFEIHLHYHVWNVSTKSFSLELERLELYCPEHFVLAFGKFLVVNMR